MNELKNFSVYLNPNDKSFCMRRGALPVPGPNEVLLSISCTGVCATDVHLWSWGKIGNLEVESPFVLGHESCGKVMYVGSSVKKLKQGDRVAIESGTPCYACEYCLGGRYNLCANLKTCGIPPFNGTYTRYFIHDANFCYKLPESMTDEEGALVEPLSVAIHSCRRAEISAGDHVVVCGAGPIGLLVAMTAKAMGAAQVLLTDIRRDRLNFARNLLSVQTLKVGEESETRTANSIRNALGQAPRVTFDCCGVEKSLRTSVFATKSGGVVVVVGLGPSNARLPIIDTVMREVDIKGAVRYPNCYQRSIDMISAGVIDVKPLITHRFKLAELPEAFLYAQDGRDGAIKVIINCQE